MVLKQYDFVFVTHLPSFYKTNLYNEIAKSCSVFVFFLGQGSQARTNDFTQQEKKFDFEVLNQGAFESRSIFNTIKQLTNTLKTIRYKKLILGGWDLPEFWVLAFLKPKQLNWLALESSIYESQLSALKSSVKKIFLSRMRGVLYSGEPHLKLLKKLKYHGQTIKTGGVGLMYMANSQANLNPPKKEGLKFLYVGRLAQEKNLKFLVQCFNHLSSLQLTIIGNGPLSASLQNLANNNITFVEHIPYHVLPTYYQSHDVLIIPSIKEPWGLVVEEALYYGLPVLASNRVGSSEDLITFYQAGKLFDPYQEKELLFAVQWMVQNFQAVKHNIKNIDFKGRAIGQVNSYLQMVG